MNLYDVLAERGFIAQSTDLEMAKRLASPVVAYCGFDPTADTQQGRELAATTAEHAAASDGFLVGRTTFKEMCGFWTQKVDDKIRSH